MREKTRAELVIVGHSDSITALAFSADGKTLVSGSYDETAIVWDVETGHMKRLFRLREFVNRLALTPDGQILVTDDGQVWEAQTGRLLRRSRQYMAPFACSPNGKMLACAAFVPDADSVFVLLSDIRTGRTKRLFACCELQPDSLSFSSDGELVAACGYDSREGEESPLSTTVCNVRTGETHRVLRGQRVFLFGAALTPDTRLIALSPDGKQIWDAETETSLYTIEREDFPYSFGSTHYAGLSPDGRLIAVGTDNGYLTVYEVSTSRQLWQTQAHTGWLRTVAFTSDSRTFATAGDDHAIHLWNANNGERQHTFIGQGPEVKAVSFSADGKVVTAIYSDDSARLWSLDRACLERQEANRPGVLSLGAPKNPHTARHLWRLSPSLLPERMENGYPPMVVAISPDGSLVALHGYEHSQHSLLIWDIKSRKVQSTMLDTYSPWGAITFSPDNRLLAISAGWEPNKIRLYNVQTGNIEKEWVTTLENVLWAFKLMFSPDGRTLASGHADYAIVLWDLSSGKSKRILNAHTDGPCALAFSPDGKTLTVETSHSPVVWLKSLKRGGKQRFLRGHTADIRTVNYSPDGTRLATGAQDGTVRLWEAASGKLLATLLALPAEEWILYTPEGYYTGSPGAEQYIRWRVGVDLLPAERFTGVFRKPEKVQSRLMEPSEQGERLA